MNPDDQCRPYFCCPALYKGYGWITHKKLVFTWIVGQNSRFWFDEIYIANPRRSIVYSTVTTDFVHSGLIISRNRCRYNFTILLLDPFPPIYHVWRFISSNGVLNAASLFAPMRLNCRAAAAARLLAWYIRVLLACAQTASWSRWNSKPQFSIKSTMQIGFSSSTSPQYIPLPFQEIFWIRRVGD